MKGLVLKDFYMYKGQMKIYTALFLFYAVFAFITKNITIMNIMVIILGINGILVIFSMDQNCKWDIYALSTPIGRKKSVISKYITMLILIAIVTIFSQIIAFTTNLYLKKITNMDLLSIGYVAFSLTIVMCCINIPFVYKLGVEKARCVIFIVLMVPTVLYAGAVKMGVTVPAEGMIKAFALMSPFILIAVVFVSMYISIKIYEKKEF